MHLRWLVQPPPSVPFSIATLRFNSSVNYGGLQFANTQEGFFSENKEKTIHAALSALVEEDLSAPQVLQFNRFIKVLP